MLRLTAQCLKSGTLFSASAFRGHLSMHCRRRLAEVQTLLSKEVVLWKHGYLAMPQVCCCCCCCCFVLSGAVQYCVCHLDIHHVIASEYV